MALERRYPQARQLGWGRGDLGLQRALGGGGDKGWKKGRGHRKQILPPSPYCSKAQTPDDEIRWGRAHPYLGAITQSRQRSFHKDRLCPLGRSLPLSGPHFPPLLNPCDGLNTSQGSRHL